MARLTDDQWLEARQRWESDPTLSFETMAESLPVTRQAISKKAKNEGWAKVGALRQVVERAQLKADSKVAQVAETGGKKTSTATLDAAVELRADVLDRHRSDWAEHRKNFTLAAIKKTFEAGKQAKISAEMLLIRQKGERAAYGLDDQGGGNTPPGQSELASQVQQLIERLPG